MQTGVGPGWLGLVGFDVPHGGSHLDKHCSLFGYRVDGGCPEPGGNSLL